MLASTRRNPRLACARRVGQRRSVLVDLDALHVAAGHIRAEADRVWVDAEHMAQPGGDRMVDDRAEPLAWATPMIPVPLPNVQKSSKPLWPTPSMTHSNDGVGASTNVGRVTVPTGTTPSTEPARKNDGRSGSGAGPARASLANAPDAIET